MSSLEMDMAQSCSGAPAAGRYWQLLWIPAIIAGRVPAVLFFHLIDWPRIVTAIAWQL
jgi:hypothetical protein